MALKEEWEKIPTGEEALKNIGKLFNYTYKWRLRNYHAMLENMKWVENKHESKYYMKR